MRRIRHKARKKNPVRRFRVEEEEDNSKIE